MPGQGGFAAVAGIGESPPGHLLLEATNAEVTASGVRGLATDFQTHAGFNWRV